MKPRRRQPPAELRKDLVAVIAGFDRLASRGDTVSEETVRALRRALLVDTTSRRRSSMTTTCSTCGKPVGPTRCKKRPGGTETHPRLGARCPGSDLPFAAHDEIRAERATARTLEARIRRLGFGLFGPLEEGRA